MNRPFVACLALLLLQAVSASPMTSPQLHKVELHFENGLASLNCRDYGACLLTVRHNDKTVKISEESLKALGTVVPGEFRIYSRPFDFNIDRFSFEVQIECPPEVRGGICIGGYLIDHGTTIEPEIFFRRTHDGPLPITSKTPSE